MDPELLKALASQGIFALLFGYLGHRTLKQADKDRERWDELGVKMVQVMDKITEKLTEK